MATKNRCQCAICGKEITEPLRIQLNERYRGALTTIENYHPKCWNKLIDFCRDNNFWKKEEIQKKEV